MLAEREGELVAAVPLTGGPALADPFFRTVEFVELIQSRARRLHEEERREATAA